MSATRHEPVLVHVSSPSQIPQQPAHSKLRASCDACGQAKIKCDRNQPACTRCVTQGQRCIYGVSRKAGKPPRKRPASSSPLPSRPDFLKTAATSIDLDGSGNRGILDGLDMMLSWADAVMPTDSPFPTTDAAFRTWFPFDNVENLDTLTPPFSSDQDSPMSGQGDPIDSAMKPIQGSIASPATATAPSMLPSVRPYCTQEAKDIMRQLYCANPSTSVSDGVPARSLDLDSVLTRNRDVVAHLARLLKCPCARSPHTAMLYASVISRVLLWYQQAVVSVSEGTAAISPLPPNTPTQTVQEETVSPFSSSSTLKTFGLTTTEDNRGVSVLSTPVMVGTFQSNDKSLQTAMTNCLLLSELRKAGDLIDAFSSLGTSSLDLQTAADACPTARDFNSNVVDPSLFASLGAWLRAEHGRIVRMAKSGISVLDENLSL